MITQHHLRQRSALLARSFSPIKIFRRQTERRLHQVPLLTHQAYLEENGLPGVFSKEGFDLAWNQYQGYLVAKLNAMTEGSKDANVRTKELLLEHARDASMASLFNHASMAHNNHFFFEALRPTKTTIPNQLAAHIDGSFSSLDSFRTTFIATAAAMFGPGFVWLVKQNTGPIPTPENLAILTTYIAGSPYPGAHFRQQPIDQNTQTTGITPNMSAMSYGANIFAGSFGAHSIRNTPMAPGGVGLEILLCVSTWEHVWLLDHGVDGKRRFLEAWWDKIDWTVVSNRADWNQRPHRTKIGVRKPGSMAAQGVS